VTKLVSGDSFGELALLNDEPRAATITCVNQCYFATLGKCEYNKILSKIELRHQQKKIDYFHELPFFKFHMTQMLRKIVHQFTVHSFMINQTIS
jgi:CRP-like cAMP-binding protein